MCTRLISYPLRVDEARTNPVSGRERDFAQLLRYGIEWSVTRMSERRIRNPQGERESVAA